MAPVSDHRLNQRMDHATVALPQNRCFGAMRINAALPSSDKLRLTLARHARHRPLNKAKYGKGNAE